MEEGVKITLAGVGLVVGMRVGLLGLAIFWYVLGLMYLLVKIPLAMYREGFSIMYRLIEPGIADTSVLIIWIVFILLIGIRMGIWFFRGFGFHLLPQNLNSALGAALGLSTGIIIATILFSG